MHDSRSDRRALTIAAALLAAALASEPAEAQVGPPIRLLPPLPSASGGTTAPETGSPTPSDPSDIQATPLAPVDSAWTGTLTTADGAFPETLWQGTPRALVIAALPQLRPTASPTLQDLSRRLLLSNALAPAGEDPGDGPGLAMARLDRLVALGQVDDALVLADRLRPRRDSETLDRLKVQLHFLANDTEGACAQVQAAIDRYQDPWWDRALIACQALAGDPAKASLGLTLLRERNVPRDPLFDSLIEAVGGRAVKIDHLPDPTPIRIVLLAAAKLPLPADALKAADSAVLHSWASNTRIPSDRRIAAAERAASLGALPLQQLRDLYTEIGVKPEDRKTASTQANDNPRARALLFTAAQQESDPAARLGALNALLQAARKRGEFAVTARLVAPVLAEIQPTADLAEYAPEAVRALYVAERPNEARQWLRLANPAGGAALEPLARLAEGASGPAWPKAGLKGVLAGLQPQEGGAPPGRAFLVAALLAATGEPVTPADWAGLAAATPMAAAPLPNPALLLDQEQAAASHRLGETVLMTVAFAHSGERLNLEPSVIAQAVSGLRAVGLEGDARRLAVEAALAGGI